MCTLMDLRTDLPPVVLAMAVTRDGVGVRCRTSGGNTAGPAVIRTVKGDLAGRSLSASPWTDGAGARTSEWPEDSGWADVAALRPAPRRVTP